jgi:hypothetical protein
MAIKTQPSYASNLISLQSELQDPTVTIQDLMQYAQGTSPAVPEYMALAELNRRKQLQAVSQAAQPPTSTVKSQIEAGLGALGKVNPTAPQGMVSPFTAPQPVSMDFKKMAPVQPGQAPQPAAPLPQPQGPAVTEEEPSMAHGGLASMPLHHMFHKENFATGGIVAFANGGDTDDSDDDLPASENPTAFMTGTEREQYLDAMSSLGRPANTTGTQVAQAPLFPPGTEAPITKDYRDTVQPYGGLHDNSMDVIRSVGQGIGDFLDSLSPSGAALRKRNDARLQGVPADQTIMAAHPAQVIDTSANISPVKGGAITGDNAGIASIVKPAISDVGLPPVEHVAAAAKSANDVVKQVGKKAPPTQDISIPSGTSGNIGDLANIVSNPSNITLAPPPATQPAPGDFSLSDVVGAQTHSADGLPTTSTFSALNNANNAPSMAPAAPAAPVVNPLSKYGINAPEAVPELKDIRAQQLEEHRMMGISETPAAKAEEMQRNIEARWAKEHEHDNMDRLIAQLNSFASADPTKGFGYAMAVGANASQNLNKQQQQLRDAQDKASLAFWQKDAAEDDARKRGDLSELKTIQAGKKKDLYDYAKASQDEQKVNVAQGELGVAQQRLVNDNNHRIWEETQKFKEEQQNKKRELDIAAGRLGVEQGQLKIAQEAQPGKLTEQNLHNYSAYVNNNPEMKRIEEQIKTLDLSVPTDYMQYLTLMGRKNDFERQAAKIYKLDIPPTPIEPPAKKVIPGGWTGTTTMDVDPLLKPYEKGAASNPQQAKSTTVAKRPEGVPPGVNYKYSPSQDKYWWQDENGNWKSNK